MQLSVENRQGIRYMVRVGWAYQMGIPMKVDATQLLSMFDNAVIQEIYEHFFGLNGISCNVLSVSIQSSQAGTVFLGPLSEAPGHLSSREKEIYLALVQNRLIIEEAPFAATALADKQAELITKIRMGLQQIVAQERAEAALIQQRHEQRSKLEKVGAYIDRGATGVGNAAWGLAVWAKDVLEVAALTHPLRQSIELSSATANYLLYDKSFEESHREYLSAVQREVVDVLGFDPSQITKQQLELACEVAQLIYEDPALRDTIFRFAQDYVSAQHSLEITEMAGGGAFEIILTIVLAAVTGGVGAVAAMVKNARLLKAFRGIGDLMLDFAKLKKQRNLLSKKRGGNAKGNGASFSDLSTSEAAAPPSSSGSSPSSSSSSSSSSNGSSNSNQSSQGSGSGSNADGGNQASGSSTSNEPDSANSETGTNQNGSTSQCNANACEGGEPINLKTGEERLTLVDTVLDGPLPLTVARTYRSSNPKDFGMGHGWTHTLGEKLLWRPGKAVQLHDAEGRVINLPAPGDSGRSHNVVEQLTLTRVNDEHWIVTPYGAPNGVQRHFKAIGDKGTLKLAEIRDGYGNFYLFHYIDERLLCIESSLGEALHISPPEGQAKSLRIGELKKETRDGHIKVLANYEYSDEGDLIKATDADGHSEQYQYRQHVIKQRTLKTGYRFHFEWDAEGPSARCVRQWGDPIDGQATYNYQFDWDDDGKGVTVTDTRGGKERYRFNDRALPIYHRDPEGAETLYSYNDLGQITKVQLPSDDGSLREEIYQYDDQGRLVQKTDAAGNKHRIEYNSEGLPAKVTDPAGNKWQREYNKKGQIAA
ncbi:DUF6531 domain-containing protein, partial [uncultured Microbulbifer sp.]|uniref:DUF6531 domain-containing protein n=1 Tax=uncultured Microbulbifer sp. TaxID=348147 RepID=UPI002631B9C2